MSGPLPEFESPPVVEVALSVQFDRLDTSTVQLALAWQRFRSRFGRIEEKPELDPVFERFAPPEKRLPGVRFEVGVVPGLRFWFLNDDGNELIQVQRDRFVRNWRKTEGRQDYPRYDNLRQAFVEDWTTFADFAAEEVSSELVPNQVEVTYVNIIETDDTSRLDEVLACVTGTYSDEYLSEPEEAEAQFHFVLNREDGKPWGRLHVVADPAVRAADDQRVLRLSLTARGNPPSRDMEGVMAAMDAGHEAVVRGFTSITTPQMHTRWGRKS